MVNSLTGLDDILEKIDSEILTETTKQLVPTIPVDSLANGGENANFNGQLVRLPVYPKWFFTARIGQPRKINYLEIRKFAQSPWVQMVLSTIKKEVSTIPFDFKLTDDTDDGDYSELKKELKQFFNKVDDERNSIVDLCNESITDLGEIDALAWVKVFSTDSYEWREVDIEDDVGNIIGTERRPMLKPFGQRTLLQVRNADPATFLKQIDIFKRLKAYYQYSWKNPRSSPIRFEPDEVAYNMLNKRSHELYGFSPVQSIQQVLELLIQSTRYNKDFFRNNAFPDGMISLPGANAESMKQFKEMWLQQVKGKPHKLIWHNTDAKFNAFNASNKDMEWLEGQKWYFHLVFGAFGVSPVEAGFHENVNMGNTAGQERVTIRNAIKPFLQVLEDTINKFIMPELLQEEFPKLCFRFQPIDHGADITEFDQAMRELQSGTLTINEWRIKQGRPVIEGGDEPSNLAAQRQAQQALNNNPNNAIVNNNSENKKKTKIFEELDIETPIEITNKETILEPGEDIIEVSDDYASFYKNTILDWKAKTLKALEEIPVEKKFDTEVHKEFGAFLSKLMNGINSAVFLKVIRKFIKKGMVAGVESVEEETSTDIGFTFSMNERLKALEGQEINGYKLPDGKVWPGIKGATKKLQFEILKSVEESVKNKEGRKEMTDKIVKIFDGSSKAQAERIARTETTRFINEGKLASYQEIGMKYKSWDAVMDTRTSDIDQRLHNKYQSEPIPIDEMFVDEVTGKQFMYPPSHPNCRCVISGKMKKS